MCMFLHTVSDKKRTFSIMQFLKSSALQFLSSAYSLRDQTKFTSLWNFQTLENQLIELKCAGEGRAFSRAGTPEGFLFPPNDNPHFE